MSHKPEVWPLRLRLSIILCPREAIITATITITCSSFLGMVIASSGEYNEVQSMWQRDHGGPKLRLSREGNVRGLRYGRRSVPEGMRPMGFLRGHERPQAPRRDRSRR